MRLFIRYIIFLFFLISKFDALRAQNLQLLSPNGGEVYTGGSTQTISWSYSNVDNIKIEYSMDNGLNWILLTGSYPASALNYSWRLPCIGSNQVKVRITNILQFTQDESNNVFTIPEPTVDISYPDGGESFPTGTGQYITWSTTGVSTLALEYTINNGQSWVPIGNVPAGNSYANWIAPSSVSSQARIRGYNLESTRNRDSSASLFNISTLPITNNNKFKGGNYDGYKMCSSLPDSVRVISPNGGEVYSPTNNISINWSFRNVDRVRVEYSVNNGSTWNIIASDTAADVQSIEWVIPNLPSTKCLVRVSGIDRPVSDLSNATFTITSAFVKVVYPNGGESFGAGTGQYIEWDFNAVSTVNIEYSTNNGVSWNSIGTAPAGNRYANWIPPATISGQYLIRVSDNSTPSLNDVSDDTLAVFNILQNDPAKYKGGNYDGYSMANSLSDTIKLISPNGGERWTSASGRTISWSYNNVDNVSVEYSLDDGITWKVIAANIPASQKSIGWTIPTIPSNICRVRVKDASRNISDQSDSAFIIPNAYVQITYPNGGEKFGTGTGQYIEWEYTDLATVKLEYSVDNGNSWSLIGTAPAGNKYATWVVPPTVSNQLLIRATDVDNPIYTDQSNTVFSSFAIPSSDPGKFKGGEFDGYSMFAFKDAYLQVRKPNGGEIWGNGTTQQIRWATLNNNEKIILDYTIDNEATWNTLLSDAPNTQNSFNWLISSPVSNLCKVRARTTSGTLIDKSDDFFTIANPNGIITSPLAKTSYCSGESFTVNFTINTTFNQGNKFIVQLSDSVGSFNGSVENIGEITGTTPAPITVTLPQKFRTFSLYRVRVIGTN